MLESIHSVEKFKPKSNPIARSITGSEATIEKLDRIDNQAGLTRWVARMNAPALILACAESTHRLINFLGEPNINIITMDILDRFPWIFTLYETTHGEPAKWINGTEIALLAIPAVVMEYKSWRGQKKLYSDNILQTTAESLVYQGKIPLKTGAMDFKKGDNMLYVSLPRPQEGSILTPEAIQLYGRATQLALDGVRDNFAGKNYKGVVLDPHSFAAISVLEGAPRISNAQLLSGKDIDPLKGYSLIVSPKDLERMQFSKSDELRVALEALSDPILNNYFTLAQSSSFEKELLNIQRQINKYLKTSLHTHALKHFTEPQVVRVEKYPFKKRIYETVQLFTDSSGKLRLQRSTTEDGFYSVDFHRALEIEEEVTLDKLDKYATHYKGQLLYLIYELLRKNSLGELVQEEYTDPLQVAQRLTQLGFPIDKSADALYTIADTKRRLDLLKQIQRAILPVMIAAFIYAATPPIQRIVENTDLADIPKIARMIPNRVRELLTEYTVSRARTSATAVEIKHRTTVPGFPPPHTVDWLVHSSDYRSRSGYYTLATSHQMEGGEWIINQDRKKELDIPSISSGERPSEDYISIYKVLELPRVNNFHFKLPLPEGKQLSYLSLSQPHKVYELTDGTIEIVITQNLDEWFDPTVSINAYFTKVKESWLKAVSPLPKLDESRLIPGNTARVRLAIASASSDNEGTIKAVAQKVKDDHLYSIASPNIKRLDTLTTPEELVTTVAFDRVCDCDTCNSAAALETTLGQTEDQFVNIAFGYLHMNHALEKDVEDKYSSLLRGDTRHAYMLTNRGTIVDATPSVSNGDEQTEKYLEQLRKSTSYEENTDSDIFFGINHVLLNKKYPKDPKEDLNDYLSILGIVGGFGLLNGLYFGSRFMNRERRARIVQTAVVAKKAFYLSPLSEKDLELAFNFFPWMSFGGATEMRRGISHDLTKEEMLEKVKENLTKEALDDYTKNPSGLEKRAGIRGLASLKMRYLARFLQS